MIFNTTSSSSSSQTRELSAVIEHCPWAKSFLHLGSHDGQICQMVSAFFQFEQIIGLENNPTKMAQALMRKRHFAHKMHMTEFHFHHFAYPFRELSSTALVFLDCLSIPVSTQNKLSYWLAQTDCVHTIASCLSIPLHSKNWFVKSIEEFKGHSFYIYQRIT